MIFSDISHICSSILNHSDDEDFINSIIQQTEYSLLNQEVTIDVDREICKNCIVRFEGLADVYTNTQDVLQLWIKAGRCLHWSKNMEGRKSTKSGVRLVHIITALGLTRTLEVLQRKGVPLYSTTCKFKYTPLHIALLSGHCKTVLYLASQGLDVNGKCLYQGGAWLTPVFISSRRGDVEILKILRRFGADLTKELRDTMLTGDVTTIKSLIIAGADVNTKIDSMHISPLHVATRRDSVELVDILLSNGANILAKDKRGATPIHIALSGNFEKSGHFLFQRLANYHSEWLSKADLAFDASRGTSLTLLEQIILVSNFDVNKSNYAGNTLLHIASEKGHIDIVKMLLKKDCNLNSLNKDLATPLGVAISKNNQDVAKILIKSGADVDSGGIPKTFIKRTHSALNVNGSLLYGALFHNSQSITYLLLEAGLNIHEQKWLPFAIRSFKDIDKNLQSYLLNKLCKPESLQKICRYIIRKQSGPRIIRLTNDNVTQIMKDYLLMKFT